jgi:hypothetical protein
MLAGDQEIALADTTAEIAAPTADQPPVKKQLAPTYHFVREFSHRSTFKQRPRNKFRFNRSNRNTVRANLFA